MGSGGRAEEDSAVLPALGCWQGAVEQGAGVPAGRIAAAGAAQGLST